jgi:S-adenosylmethionine synthetase
VNGAGDFAVGGPEGDNGLAGKKLVVDAYGPHVPIGGGALSGKDPHKTDRAMALRARQIAKHLVIAGVADQVLVHLGFAPGDREPRWQEVRFGTCDYQHDTVAWRSPAKLFAERWLKGYDLTIGGTFRDLHLRTLSWSKLAAWGYFWNHDLPWEQWNPGMSIQH